MIPAEWLKAFAPIGVVRGNKWFATGAGVFIHAPPVNWLVTARHLVSSSSNVPITIVVRLRKGGVAPVNLSEVYKASKIGWVEDDERDIAAGLMPNDPAWDVLGIPREFCAPFDAVGLSSTAYTVGCPYGFAGFDPGSPNPLILDGIVAGVNESKEEVYCTAPTFPGNSGGPLLISHPPYAPNGAIMVGKKTLLLAGIVSQIQVVPDPRPKSVIPSLHLGVCISIDAGLRLISSPTAVEMMKRVGVSPSQPSEAKS